MQAAGSSRGRKRGAHEGYVREAFISAVTPEGLGLDQLTKYDTASCLWKSNCSCPRHVLFRQVQTIARRSESLDCRVCAPEWNKRSRHEVLLYRMLDGMPTIGRYAVESHVLQGQGVGSKSAILSLRRHATDVWLVDLGKVLIELDGSQHTHKPMHGENLRDRAHLDASIDAAAVAEGWWIIRIIPGQGLWQKRAQEAIVAAAQGVRNGGEPRAVIVSC